MRKPIINEARIKRAIAQRLSLRKPQEKSLDILADVVSHINFDGSTDPVALLEEIAKIYPSVESFERAFPSLCFALATGVGKTRLMGAMIAYLYQTGRSRNFFVLAPNTTIYKKLIDDFSIQSSPKYVFRGIAEFAQKPPIIVTGDTWEEGRGVRGSDLFDETIINIFNVDKINKDAGKIKGFKETIGDSYFDYLAGLDDLVMFMDEAHRYRAKAATKAIFELSPKLGVELTATPKTTGAKPKDFKNVIYYYGLGNAMADGYVKEPAVLTRADFSKVGLDADQLEQIMLEDGVHYHNHVDAELDLYSRETGRKRVHPFMLVVAQNTEHAASLRAKIESDEFFNGSFIGRVAEVHSKLKGDESNEAMDRLVGLETTNDTDIVIHVNKLKEGWDVTNLYTIVPLRASASEILTEQTLGRGLRLPYGERTGNDDVDRLTVIAHDKFDDVVKKAREEDSVVKLKTLTIGENGDISDEAKVVVEAVPNHIAALTGARSVQSQVGGEMKEPEQPPITYNTEEEQSVAKDTLNVIDAMSREIAGVKDLQKPEVQKEIQKRVRALQERQQGQLEGIVKQPDVAGIVAQVTKVFADNIIEIPDIVVLPSGEVNFWFEDFDLKNLEQIRFQPMSDRLVIKTLREGIMSELARAVDAPREERVENYIVKHLMDHPQIDYDSQADLLYKLAGQVVEQIRSYAESEEDVDGIALAHGRQLGDFIYKQMEKHYRATPADYIPKVTRSYRVFKGRQFTFSPTKQLFLDEAAKPLSATKNYVFKGGRKCPDQFHKFDSDPERRFAVLIDSDFETGVLRWLKPAAKQFQIEYDKTHKLYEPDFVVETTDMKLVVEIKADRDMSDPVVLEKKRAALVWVDNANRFEAGGKIWKYLLVSESDISESATLEGIIAKCG